MALAVEDMRRLLKLAEPGSAIAIVDDSDDTLLAGAARGGAGMTRGAAGLA